MTTTTTVSAKACPKGEYVKRKADSKKVYIRGDYVRELKAYSLIDTEDHCHEIFVKGATLLHIGFTY